MEMGLTSDCAERTERPSWCEGVLQEEDSLALAMVGLDARLDGSQQPCIGALTQSKQPLAVQKGIRVPDSIGTKGL